MPTVILTPREEEILRRDAWAQGENKELLTLVQTRMTHRPGGYEVTLSEGELARVGVARHRYRNGAEQQFKTLLDAFNQHGFD